MHAYSLLTVIGANGYCKCYANGRRITATRRDLITCHARMGGSHDCFATRIHKDGRVFHRSEARTKFAI